MENWIERKSKNIDEAYIKCHLEDDILSAADLIMDDKFVFIRTWDMEPSHIPYHLEPFDWHCIPNGDEEWAFMLNRFTYLSHLALAEIKTDDKAYLIKGKALILDWIYKHDTLELSLSTRTLDTAMRISSWLEFLPYLYRYNLLDKQELRIIQTSIEKQIVYMYENYIPKYHMSNWGSIQTATILYVLFILDDFRRDIYQWAYEEFIHQMEIQVYDDGLFWEQSTMYHVEVLSYALKILDQLPLTTQNRIKSLAIFLLYQRTPKNTIEPYGDSDVADLTSIMNLCAVKFKDGRFKMGKLNNADNLYVFEKDEIDAFEKMTREITKQLNFDGETMYTHRTSWEEDAHFTLFTNGSMGSGHAHVDNNHFSIYFKGDPIIVDTGRYTYREDHPYRIYFKSASAHSGLVLDGRSGSQPNGSWTFQKYVQPLGNQVKHKGPYHYYKGMVYGDFSLWERILVVVDLGIWIVIDKVKSQGRHKLTQYFNLHPDVKSSIEDEIFLNDMKMKVLKGELTLEDSLYSQRYNQLEDSQRIVIDCEFEDENIMQTIFYDGDYTHSLANVYRDGILIEDDNLVSAHQFLIKENHTITIVMVHRELFDGRKNLECNGVALHAKTSIIEKINGEINYYELSTI